MTYRPMNTNDDDLRVPEANSDELEVPHNVNKSPPSLLEPTFDHDKDISEAVSEFDGAAEHEDRGMSVVVEVEDVRYLMTPQICQTRNDTLSSDLPTKRKRIRRAVELNGCYCGNVLSSSMAGVVECKRTGCETQWVSRILL